MLVLDLEPNCLIVLDKALYRSIQMNKPPALVPERRNLGVI
jgi:hypothetical protein